MDRQHQGEMQMSKLLAYMNPSAGHTASHAHYENFLDDLRVGQWDASNKLIVIGKYCYCLY